MPGRQYFCCLQHVSADTYDRPRLSVRFFSYSKLAFRINSRDGEFLKLGASEEIKIAPTSYPYIRAHAATPRARLFPPPLLILKLSPICNKFRLTSGS